MLRVGTEMLRSVRDMMVRVWLVWRIAHRLDCLSLWPKDCIALLLTLLPERDTSLPPTGSWLVRVTRGEARVSTTVVYGPTG